MQVRLLTPVSTYRSKAGTAVKALVVSPIGRAEHSAIPSGTVLRGEVARVKKVGLGLVHESATLELRFQELSLPDGSSFPIESRLVNVDNGRERVDHHGAIHGQRATDSLSHRFGARIAFAAMGHPLCLVPAFAVEAGLFRFPDPEIEYGAGTELDVQVQLPKSLQPPPERRASVPDHPQQTAQLRELIDRLPYWTYSKRQRQSMDLVNLAFLGSREELERAFAAAGWNGARPNSMVGGLKAIRAIVEEREYEDAPMRTLLLQDQPPDMERQKTLNTFEKRHHLRIWKRPDEWEGRTFWAAAATKDIATTFSMRPFGFTHEIEKDVDRERDKVVDDLVFTGCVDAVVSLRRRTPARDSADYRKGVITDSRVSALVLNSCQSPRWDAPNTGEMPQPRIWVRAVRRVTLTARNHFLRDNIFWRSGEMARLGIRALRDWHADRKSDRAAESAQDDYSEPDIEVTVVR